MTTPGSIKTLLTGLLLAAGVGLGMGLGMGLVSPAQAGDVTVTEGETATFQITVTHKWGLSSRIRVYYSAYGGTATPGQSDHGVGVDGGDYAYRNPWVHYVEGQAGQPLTITVRTHTDDLVEGDETFRIKVDGIKAAGRGWWTNTRLFEWTITDLPTITITDATPEPDPAPAPPPINWSLSACYWSSC